MGLTPMVEESSKKGGNKIGAAPHEHGAPWGAGERVICVATGRVARVEPLTKNPTVGVRTGQLCEKQRAKSDRSGAGRMMCAGQK